MPNRERPTVLYLAPLEELPTSEQRARLRAWSTGDGTRLVGELLDQEAGDLVRPGLVDALTMVRRGDVEVIAVAELQVIHPDVTGQDAYRSIVREAGGRVRPLRRPDAPELRRHLAEYEQRRRAWTRAEQAARLQDGRNRARAQDPEWFQGGRPPLGFDLSDGALIDSVQEMATVARIKELRRAGLSLTAIGETLAAERYRTKEGRTQWHPEQVRRVLLRHGEDPVEPG